MRMSEYPFLTLFLYISICVIEGLYSDTYQLTFLNSSSPKMKIICAGLPKTGTKSLVTALRHLGYIVYDSPEHALFHKDQWGAILDGNGSSKLFHRMYETVEAVADTPACAMWDHILEAFPDAKVSLTFDTQ